ncbi:phage portal protein [Nonomuraea sp. LPB2021202275-12-8]|uniref:phage portal protein n=1 Tax=Nonomuraea sp. LPB2021202275-12-8 TaxID=3120159 RepID=UPI00300C5282
MPLPTRDQEWPPPWMRPVTRMYLQHSAWYSGDPDRLAKAYGADTIPGLGLDLKGWDRPMAASGGFLGRVSRFFWGSPTPAGQSRSTKLHVPLAGDISSTSADLLFSEPPTLRVGGKKSQNRLEKILNEGSVYPSLLEAAEIASAFGGAYLRVGWDTTMAEYPVVDVIPPDASVPEFVSGRLWSVIFWRVVAEDNKQVLRHLEKHERGRVYHGLYLGDERRLGIQVPLSEHPETAHFAEMVDEDGGFASGYDKGLLVSYVPNMRPHRRLRGTQLGRSDYSGVEPLMDALDETYTSWLRDLRLGKGRVIVPDVYLQNTGRGRGSMWDPDREIYSGIGMLPPPGGSGSNMLTISQFAIRTEEHAATAKALVAQILRGAGYSTQTFGEASNDVVATATEIHSRERRSFTTRQRKIGYWNPTLSWMADVLLTIDRVVFGTKVSSDRALVEWPDGVQPDPESVGRTVNLLKQAESASADVRVRMVHPEWDDEQVEAEVERIRREKATEFGEDADPYVEAYLPRDDDLSG